MVVGAETQGRYFNATQLAAIAPITICPSTPIFHKPAVNVTNNPVEVSKRGTQKASTLSVLDWSPKAPLSIAWSNSIGLAPNKYKRSEVTSKLAKIGTTGHTHRSQSRDFAPCHPIKCPISSTFVCLASKILDIFPPEKTAIRSLRSMISSRSEDIKRIAVPGPAGVGIVDPISNPTSVHPGHVSDVRAGHSAIPKAAQIKDVVGYPL